MTRATMTSKGQLTVPKEIRERLHLKPGDKVEFVPDGDQKVILYPTNLPIEAIKGFFPPPDRPATIEEMEVGIRKGAARE